METINRVNCISEQVICAKLLQSPGIQVVD